MEISKKACKSGFLVNRSFKQTILTSDADVKKGKCGTGFSFTGELNILVLAIKIREKLRYLINRLKNQEAVINVAAI